MSDPRDIDLSASSDIDSFLGATTGDSAIHMKESLLQQIAMAPMANYDVGKIEVTAATGIDALFQREPSIASPHRRRVASLQDLSGFTRLSAETLVHRSERDLWTLKKGDGETYVIERMFDDNGEPLKG